MGFDIFKFSALLGYNIFKFGTLYLGDKIQPIPHQPKYEGNIPQYGGRTTISIRPTNQEECITWIKPYGHNILVADRILLINVSWNALARNGFIVGNTVQFGGQSFRCRLLKIGKHDAYPDEWGEIFKKTGENKALWNVNHMYFWGSDMSSVLGASYRVLHGYTWRSLPAKHRGLDVGFRPALEPIPSSSPTPNINLDGVDFQLTSIPNGDGFCPVLQPIHENVFKDIPTEGKVRMYTFLEGEKPILVGAKVKDTSKLTLTDRYYGDKYLVPWVITNGIAVGSQSLRQKGES